jgi:putative transcriptional regulator
MKAVRKKRRSSQTTYLDGQLLIAMPSMKDPRFARSVIYMCAHTREGAMGLILNQRADHITFPQLLEQLELVPQGQLDELPDEISARAVHVGGHVDTVRGFVLHTADYFAEESTLAIDDGVCLTATIDILRAMAAGNGPERAMLALGYAGWGAGQLESEIQANGWLNCPADAGLIFDPDLESKYERAISKIGIDLSHLVSEAGHA